MRITTIYKNKGQDLEVGVFDKHFLLRWGDINIILNPYNAVDYINNSSMGKFLKCSEFDALIDAITVNKIFF